MNRSRATPAPVSPPSHGLPNRAPLGSANSQTTHQNALSTSLRTTQEQLLEHHDLPRSLPPLPSLQTSNLHQYSVLQHSYLSMLANDSFDSSSVPNHTMTANSLTAAQAAAAPSLDALLESASSQYTAAEGGEDVRSTEPLTFASLFSAASSAPQQQTQTATTAPSTPFVHDVSAFTTMQNSLFAPTLFDFSSLGFPGAPITIDADQSPQTSPYTHDVGTYTPPSASDPPALSFSPTSPYDHAMLQATPSTGLTLMDVDFDNDVGDMPLFGYEDGLGLTRTLFSAEPLFTEAPAASGDDQFQQHVAPSALGLKGVQNVAQPSAYQQSTQQQQQQMVDLDGLIAMSGTPSVVPIPLSAQLATSALPSTSTSTSSSTPAGASSSPVSTRKPTGHRKNLSPSALLPVDAPTQPRSYRGPSATSRKDVPAFAIASSSSAHARGASAAPSSSTPTAAASSTPSKKRKAAAADLDDFDEDEELGELDAHGKIKPRMGESEIEAKRRQNTLAARRSRHRKLAYVRELEEKVVTLMRENESMHERLVRAGLE